MIAGITFQVATIHRYVIGLDFAYYGKAGNFSRLKAKSLEKAMLASSTFSV